MSANNIGPTTKNKPATKPGNGACVCGRVKFKANTIEPHVGACHCRTCRRWVGGPWMAVECGSDVQFQGEDNISRYQSSEWAERGFCNHCGSSLFYRLKGNNQYFIPPGLFDNPGSFNFNHQVFIDEKPSFYKFANKTNNMIGAEAFAQFSKPED